MISIYEKRCLQGSILEFLRYVCVYTYIHTWLVYIYTYTHIYTHTHAYTYIFAILAVYLFLLQITEFLWWINLETLRTRVF